MNKRGDISDWGGPVFVGIVLIIILFLLFYGLGKITANVLQINVNDGNVTTYAFQETLVSRLSSWGDSTGNGFYTVLIQSGNQTLKTSENTGAGLQIYYIKEYVQCVNVTLLNSQNNNLLNKYTLCKNG